MTSERWRRIEELYHAAMARPDSERAAFLNQACGDDESLRRKVESLIDDPDPIEKVLAPGPVEILAEPLPNDRPDRALIGQRVGAYVVQSFIDAGGMGHVYRARDTKLGRDVAIKILPPEFTNNRDLLARFEREAQILASLNHPNIVTIHEIGREGSVRFIAMEYVEGQTLRDAMARGPMPWRKLIDVAVQAADGLAKAHAAGVVHRDLKPANLMITNDGFVKILDFGLSKTESLPVQVDSRAPTRLGDATRMGAMLGTVNYMSPEQAAGRTVDFRTDQFSLGLVLSEMATGRHPFRRGTEVQTLAAIIDDEAKPISALRPRLPQALSWIVERCLAKDPEARYASTRDLARDLSALRDHLSQSPPSRSRRAWLLAVAAVVALAAWRIAGPVREWLEPSQQIPGEKQIAVLLFKNIGGEPANQYLSDGLTETLTSKLTQLERFEGSLRVVPASEVRDRNVSSADEARRAFGVNLAITGSFQRTGDNVRININLVDAKSLRQLRTLPIDTRIDNVAVMQDGVVARVAELLELELQPQARQTLAAGGTAVPGAYVFYLQGRGYLQRFDKPENVEHAADLFRQALSKDAGYALAHAGLGEAYWRKYELTKDRQWINAARDSCAKAVQLNSGLAPIHVTLGVINRGTGEPEQAIQDFKRALQLDPASADAYRELASGYVVLGRLQEAESTYQQAIKVRSTDWASYNSLGVFYVRRTRYADAEAQFKVVTELTPDNYQAFRNLGGLYVLMNRYDDAVAMLEKSMAISPSYAAASNLGTAYFYQGRYAESAGAFERALAMNDRDYQVWRNLAAAYRWAPGQQDKMRPTYKRAAQMAEADLKVNRRQPEVLMHLADCYSMLDQPEQARQYLQQALESSPVDDPALWFTAGNVYEQLGDRQRALDHIGRAIRQGYSVAQIERAPELAQLRADPHFKELLKTSHSK
jgi:serine/threonine protein kinase/tetratricopeptide (TPR) repeat protein